MIRIDRNTDVNIKCFKCGNSYTMDQMRMDPNGKNLVCRNCLDRKSQVKSASSEPLSARPFKATPQGLQKSSDKLQYFCKACKYNFTRAAHIPVTTCPYCSSAGSIVKKGSASSLVREVEDLVGDDE